VRSDDHLVMRLGAGEFDYLVRGNREVRVTRSGRTVAVLRGGAAARFLADVATGDPQQVMARVTGNYKRGNERVAKSHHRNQRG
jgi:hypothetical protein